MKFSQNIVVGLVFFAGLALLLHFTVIADPEALEGIGITRGTAGADGDQRVFHVTFDNAGNMSPGTPVKASGMKIGTVKDLDFNPKNGKVDVTMEIWEPDLKLYPNHKFTVKPESALGGQYVDLEIGDTTADPLTEKQEKESLSGGTTQDDALNAVAKMVEENRPNLRQAIDNIRRVTDDLANGRGTLGALITERQLYDELDQLVDEVRQTVTMARDGDGSVAKFLRDPKVYDEISAAAENVREITRKINEGEGSIGPLVNDDAAYQDLRRALANLDETLVSVRNLVSKAERGEGTIGALFNDRSLYDNFNTAARNISEVSSKLNSGQGTLGRLLTDDELYQGLLATVGNIKEVSEDVNRGRGTVGKLVKDETLYFELRKAVRSITASVEDAREQAPVSLFTSIIFNAF